MIKNPVFLIWWSIQLVCQKRIQRQSCWWTSKSKLVFLTLRLGLSAICSTGAPLGHWRFTWWKSEARALFVHFELAKDALRVSKAMLGQRMTKSIEILFQFSARKMRSFTPTPTQWSCYDVGGVCQGASWKICQAATWSSPCSYRLNLALKFPILLLSCWTRRQGVNQSSKLGLSTQTFNLCFPNYNSCLSVSYVNMWEDVSCVCIRN